VVAWFSGRKLTTFSVSVITILEQRLGVVGIMRRDPAQAAVYQNWLQHVLEPEFGARVLSIDVAIAIRCAELHAGQPRPYRDSLIAATALVHDLTVVTGNVKDFAPMGVAIVNPWD
jgi:predicted nucleic acid-binding protein